MIVANWTCAHQLVYNLKLLNVLYSGFFNYVYIVYNINNMPKNTCNTTLDHIQLGGSIFDTFSSDDPREDTVYSNFKALLDSKQKEQPDVDDIKTNLSDYYKKNWMSL